MEFTFSNSDRKDFDLWISARLEEKYSWEEIENKKYEALSKIDMDLKEEIERFMDRGVSPASFGPRIRNTPEIKNFLITSKKKSQQAEYDDFDFSGDTYETNMI